MSGYEYILPLSIAPYNFVGKKAAAVLFSDERVDVKTWREVVGVILRRCNSEQHERLMYLRDKVAGKVRMIFASSDLTMRRPLKIDEDCYIETQYGLQTMMYILCELILPYTGFDYSGIKIVLKGGG